jgi:hypothetical protein
MKSANKLGDLIKICDLGFHLMADWQFYQGAEL